MLALFKTQWRLIFVDMPDSPSLCLCLYSVSAVILWALCWVLTQLLWQTMQHASLPLPVGCASAHAVETASAAKVTPETNQSASMCCWPRGLRAVYLSGMAAISYSFSMLLGTLAAAFQCVSWPQAKQPLLGEYTLSRVLYWSSNLDVVCYTSGQHVAVVCVALLVAAPALVAYLLLLGRACWGCIHRNLQVEAVKGAPAVSSCLVADNGMLEAGEAANSSAVGDIKEHPLSEELVPPFEEGAPKWRQSSSMAPQQRCSLTAMASLTPAPAPPLEAVLTVESGGATPPTMSAEHQRRADSTGASHSLVASPFQGAELVGCLPWQTCIWLLLREVLKAIVCITAVGIRGRSPGAQVTVVLGAVGIFCLAQLLVQPWGRLPKCLSWAQALAECFATALLVIAVLLCALGLTETGQVPVAAIILAAAAGVTVCLAARLLQVGVRSCLAAAKSIVG